MTNEELQIELNKLAEYTAQRMDELEHGYERLRKSQKASIAKEKSNRLLTYGLGGLAAVAIAGVNIQQGQFSWAFNTDGIVQVLQVLGTLGVLGAGSLVAIAARSDPKQPSLDDD